ncbi:MAG: hypothetical protein NTW87_29655 [Planctomycetota bacterium]|nr:hypothetical protein [Planctomycetota bacterium]
MNTIRLACAICLGLSLTSPYAARSAEGEARPGAAVAAWDTGTSSAAALAPAALTTKAGWTQVPVDQTNAAFKGDAVITNGRLWAVARKQAAAVEVYSAASGTIASCAQLRLLARGGDQAARLGRVALKENAKAAVTLEVACKTEKGADLAVTLRLKRGGIALETDPGPGADKLRLECAGQFVVLPDFFADDIVTNPRKISLPQVEVPSENLLLHLIPGGNAIAMCVFENREQEVKLLLSGEGDKRVVTAAEIAFGEPGKQPPPAAQPSPAQPPAGRKIWLAFLEAPRIWHTLELQAADATKIMPLQWKMPFVAQWRVDLSRPDDLTDSWEMLLQDKQGDKYWRPGWLRPGEDTIPPDRKRWTTVLGPFLYPCWSDPDRQGFLQPLKHKELSFVGPVVIYPINRAGKTPADAYAVADVMRDTLGVGPCEYLLDVENQQSKYVGRATCSTRDKLGEIYKNGQQKQKRAEVEKTLDEALTFVKHIRGRITRYVDFGHKILEYLAEQKKAHAELSEPIATLEKLTAELDVRFDRRKAEIKTPEHVAAMNDEFRKNVLDDTSPGALDKCKAYAKALVVIGGSQDELAGECRWVVKSLRQRAGTLMAVDPRIAPIANEIRARTQEALRNPAGHEGARH